jgi:hypothetical protein
MLAKEIKVGQYLLEAKNGVPTAIILVTEINENIWGCIEISLGWYDFSSDRHSLTQIMLGIRSQSIYRWTYDLLSEEEVSIYRLAGE